MCVRLIYRSLPYFSSCCAPLLFSSLESHSGNVRHTLPVTLLATLTTSSGGGVGGVTEGATKNLTASTWRSFTYSSSSCGCSWFYSRRRSSLEELGSEWVGHKKKQNFGDTNTLWLRKVHNFRHLLHVLGGPFGKQQQHATVTQWTASSSHI